MSLKLPNFYYVPDSQSYLHKSRSIVLWQDCTGDWWFYMGVTELIDEGRPKWALRKSQKRGPYDTAHDAAKMANLEAGTSAGSRVSDDRVSERAREKVEA